MDNLKTIVVPVSDGRLSPHFGHSREFAFVDVDTGSKEVRATRRMIPPPHEPGALPRWLAEEGASVILAGGMGGRAIQLLQAAGIEVCLGAPEEAPEDLARAWAAGALRTGANACDHGPDHRCEH